MGLTIAFEIILNVDSTMLAGKVTNRATESATVDFSFLIQALFFESMKFNAFLTTLLLNSFTTKEYPFSSCRFFMQELALLSITARVRA